MALKAARPLADILEKEWDRMLFSTERRNPGLARRLGWHGYHTLRSHGSQPGFPDWTIWKLRVIFAELKRELTGKASVDRIRVPKPAQVRFLDGLTKAGAEAYVWRPSDEQEIAHILGKPWRFYRYAAGTIGFDKPPFLAMPDGEGSPRSATVWIPRSLWIPGAGRADDCDLATEMPEVYAR